METIQALKAWKNVAHLPIMMQNDITKHRIIGVYNSLYKVLDGAQNSNLHKSLKLKRSTRSFLPTYSKITYREALKNMNAVLAYLEEEVLLNPTKHWSNNKRKEVQHFICDTIQYIIEDTEAALAKLV
tara:strand:+ start:88752 stop:89135 length:384 start_codon:yes stop_codon:yes gene_type:complete